MWYDGAIRFSFIRMYHNPFHLHRAKHTRTVVRIGLFILWAGSIGIAIGFGMDWKGIIGIGAWYGIGLLLIESVMEHY